MSLTGGTADTVVFPEEVEFVEIISDGTHDVYVAVDGNAATSAGAECRRIPTAATPVVAVVAVGGSEVSLISSGVVVYSVTEIAAGESLGPV